MKTLCTLACSLLFGISMHAQITEMNKLDKGTNTFVQSNMQSKNTMALEKSRDLSLKTTGTNANYLNISNYLESPDYIRKLQMIAAQYNVKASDVYNPTLDYSKNEAYNVTFSTNRAYVDIKYNGKGEILKSRERYTDVPVPNYIIIKIMQDYPDCIFKDAICDITYVKDKGVTRSYKIKILEGNTKRTLELDAEGNLI